MNLGISFAASHIRQIGFAHLDREMAQFRHARNSLGKLGRRGHQPNHLLNRN